MASFVLESSLPTTPAPARQPTIPSDVYNGFFLRATIPYGTFKESGLVHGHAPWVSNGLHPEPRMEIPFCALERDHVLLSAAVPPPNFRHAEFADPVRL